MKMQKKRIVQCGLSLICAFGIALSGDVGTCRRGGQPQKIRPVIYRVSWKGSTGSGYDQQ